MSQVESQINDEFIGTILLEITPQQEEIELYLGVDDRLKGSTS